MPTKIANIAKNTSYFTLALILQKVISFSYFAVLARNLPPEDLGKYYFAISFTTVFAIFIDVGLSNVLTREVAKRPNEAGKLMSSTVLLKLPLAALSLLALVIAINVMGYPELTRTLVYVSAVSMILDSFTAVFFATARGLHNLAYESVASVIFQLVVLGTGLAVFRFGNGGLPLLMGALALASTINVLYSALLVRWKFGLPIFAAGERAAMRALAIVAVPFALYGIIQRAYQYFDTVLLSKLAGDHEVGLYQVAFKVLFAIQFLPLAFTASLYPAFAAYWQEEGRKRLNRSQSGSTAVPPTQLVISFERALNYLTIIGWPIAVGIAAIAPEVIAFFGPEYSDAIMPLRLTALAIVPLFLNYPVGSLLNACDRQRLNTGNIGFTLVASIILNVFLIPRWGASGAAVTVLITNLLMLGLGLVVVPQIAPVRFGKVFTVMLKTIMASLAMAIAVLSLKPFLNIFLVVPLAGALYFSGLFILGGFTKEDLNSILQTFKKVSS